MPDAQTVTYYPPPTNCTAAAHAEWLAEVWIKTRSHSDVILSDLVGVRVTKALISKFYPDPILHALKRDKYCLLYSVDRLASIFVMPEFVEQLDKTLRRSRKGAEIAAVVIERNIASVDDIEVTVEKWDADKLRRVAIRAWEDWNEDAWIDDSDPSCPGSWGEHTKRITANFVRHNLTAYEEELDELRFKWGKDIMYLLLKDKIMYKVYETYPFLEPSTNQPTPVTTSESNPAQPQ